jgi:hypothetical protein
LTRPPRPAELERLSRYYIQQKPELAADPEARKRLFPAEGVDGVDVSEAAIWVGISSILLNLDEFITRR